MATQARSRELAAQAFFYIFDMDGNLSGKVRSVTGGDITFEIATNREGGSIFPQKMATIADTGEVTLQRAVLPSDSSFYDWLLDQADVLADMPVGSGLRDPDTLRDIVIVGEARDRTRILQWTLHGCSVAGYPMFQFDNMGGDLLIEELRIVYEWPEVDFLG